MSLKKFLVMVPLLFIPWPASADHLPDNLVSRSKPERGIGSIIVGVTKPNQVIARLGKPIRGEHRETKSVAGDRTYSWHLADCTLEVTTQIDQGIESPVMLVSVRGSHPSTDCTTAAGLSLGAELSDVRRLYGRFQMGHKSTDHTRYIHVEWKNATEGDIDFDTHDRVNHITIYAAE